MEALSLPVQHIINPVLFRGFVRRRVRLSHSRLPTEFIELASETN